MSVAETPQNTEDLAAPKVEVNSYDAIPYCVGAFPQTHPDRLATVAKLFGLSPAWPDECRVLELGCASGGNLIPMALGSPRSAFVGIDLSARQVADGLAMIGELGLTNVRLVHQSIMDVTKDLGLFDYILVHGVYSWVPPDVQRKILEICNRNLSPSGVAYVSYNTYPGWHSRGAIREMLWYHTQHFPDPAQRIQQARALLVFLVKSTTSSDGGYGALFRQELALLMRVPDSYLLHEHLEECNEPLYFHQFVQRAAEQGLQYLGEAQVSAMLPSRFGPEVEQTLRKISTDLLHLEQYMDFLRNRMFRQTLLCHADQKPDFALRADAVHDLYIASPAKSVSEHPQMGSDQPEEFRGEGSATLRTHDPLMKAAMSRLAAVWPMALSFDDLNRQATATLNQEIPAGSKLASRLLNCYASGLCEFWLTSPKFTTEVSTRPVASPYARLCARRGLKVTNMRLQSAAIDGPSQWILHHLDGQHDRAALADLVVSWLKERSATRSREQVEQFIDELLTAFAQAALLTA